MFIYSYKGACLAVHRDAMDLKFYCSLKLHIAIDGLNLVNFLIYMILFLDFYVFLSFLCSLFILISKSL